MQLLKRLADKLEARASVLARTNDFNEDCDQSFAAEIQHDTLVSIAHTIRETLDE